MIGFPSFPTMPVAVVPVLVGPLQVLFAVLPGILVALGTLALSLLKPRVMKQGLLLAWRLKLPLVGMVGAAFLTVWGIRTLVLAHARGGSDTEFVAGNWPMFRGGLARRGSVPGDLEPNAGTVVWSFKQGAEGFFSTPAVVGDRVYVASAELSAFGSSGRIYCFDAHTGAVIWAAEPEHYAATFSSPVVAGDYLVCGEGLHTTTNARVVCLALGAGRKGETLWTFETHNHVECTPVIEGDRVFVNAGDDGIYCLHLAPQPAGASQLIWHLPGEKYLDAETALAVHEGRVYVGLGLGGRSLRVLAASTGAELARLDTPYPVFSPPAIANGRLYVGLGNGDYVNTAEEARDELLEKMKVDGKTPAEIEAARKTLGPAGEVWCVDLESWQPVWKLPVSQTVLGAVALAPEGLYFATRTGDVHFVSSAGEPLAEWSAQATILASPAVTEHFVYVVTNRGTLYALERESLAPVWEARVGSQPLCISSPTVAHGHVYLGTQHDGFLCVGEPGPLARAPLAPLWAGPLGGAGQAGNVDHSPLPADALLRQATPLAAHATNNTHASAPPAAAGGHVVVPVAGRSFGLVGLETPALHGNAPTPPWTYTTPHAVALSPVIVGETSFVIDGQAGDAGRALHAVHLATGEKAWSILVAATVPGVLAASRTQLVAQVEPELLSAYTLGGERIWTTSLGTLHQAPAITENMIVAASSAPPALTALDLLTGKVLWQASLTEPANTGPAVQKDVIYLGTAAGVQAFSLLDGAPRAGWVRDPAPVASELCLQTGLLAYTTATGELVLVDPVDGHVRRRIDGALPPWPPLVSRDVLLFVGPKAIRSLDWRTRGAEPEVWCSTDELGPAETPLILHAASVFQVRGGQLVRWGGAP